MQVVHAGGAGEGDRSCQLSFGKQQLLVLLLYRALNDKLFIFQSSGANTLHLSVLPCAPSTAQTQEVGEAQTVGGQNVFNSLTSYFLG